MPTDIGRTRRHHNNANPTALTHLSTHQFYLIIINCTPFIVRPASNFHQPPLLLFQTYLPPPRSPLHGYLFCVCFARQVVSFCSYRAFSERAVVVQSVYTCVYTSDLTSTPCGCYVQGELFWGECWYKSVYTCVYTFAASHDAFFFRPRRFFCGCCPRGSLASLLLRYCVSHRRILAPAGWL